MCGIAGYSLTDGEIASINRALLNRALGEAIEHRGRDATGLIFYRDGVLTPHIVKRAESATKFFAGMPDVGKGATRALIHTRNATNGPPTNPLNNHPHTWGPVNLIHNGIISNFEPVFDALNHKAYSDCDSEAAAVAIAEKGPVAGLEMISGWASVAWFDETQPDITYGANLDGDHFLLITEAGSIVFGSEKATVLDPFVIAAGIDGYQDKALLYEVHSGMGWTHDRSTGTLTWWDFDEDAGRKNYPKKYAPSSYSYRGGGMYGAGWGDDDWDARWEAAEAARLRAITDGTAKSDFASAVEGPIDAESWEEGVHSFNDTSAPETSRLPFALGPGRNDGSLARSDGVLVDDADDPEGAILVRVGDTIRIGNFAAQIVSVESEDEIEVKWLDVFIDLTTTPITLLERATDNEEVLT